MDPVKRILEGESPESVFMEQSGNPYEIIRETLDNYRRELEDAGPAEAVDVLYGAVLVDVEVNLKEEFPDQADEIEDMVRSHT